MQLAWEGMWTAQPVTGRGCGTVSDVEMWAQWRGDGREAVASWNFRFGQRIQSLFCTLTGEMDLALYECLGTGLMLVFLSS